MSLSVSTVSSSRSERSRLTEDIHPRNVEQGIGALAPRVARDARTVIHVEVFNPSGSLVASDLEGLDTLIPAPPRRT